MSDDIVEAAEKDLIEELERQARSNIKDCLRRIMGCQEEIQKYHDSIDRIKESLKNDLRLLK